MRCLRLKTVVDDASITSYEDAVQRTHRIMQIATVLLARETMRALEADEPPPAFWRNDVVGQAIGAATVDYKPTTNANRALLKRLVDAREACLPGVELVSREGLSCVLKDQAVQYAANALTSLKLHVGKRVKRLVVLRTRLDGDAYATLTPEARKERREAVVLAAGDAVAPPDHGRRAPEWTHGVVDAARALVGIDSWDWTTARTTLDAAEKSPALATRGMHAVNRALGDAGAAVFALVPIRSSLVPRFIRVSQDALSELGLLGGQRQQERRAAARAGAERPCDEVAAIDAEIAALEQKRIDINGRLATLARRAAPQPRADFVEALRLEVERATLTGTALSGARHAVPTAELPSLKAQRRRLLVPSEGALKQLRAEHAAENAAIKAQRKAEDVVISNGERPKRSKAENEANAAAAEARKRKRAPEIAALQTQIAVEDTGGAAAAVAKSNAFREALTLPADLLREGFHHRAFGDGFATDGVSARLDLVKTTTDPPTTKPTDPATHVTKKRKTPTELPKRGIIGVDALHKYVREVAGTAGAAWTKEDEDAFRALAPRDQNSKMNALLDAAFGGPGKFPFRIVGCDPGKRELVVVIDPDVFGVAPADRDEMVADRPLTVRYTNTQRRHESQPGRYGLRTKQRADPKHSARVKRASMAEAYRRDVLATPDDVLAAEQGIVAAAHAQGTAVPCKNGPTTARFDAWVAAREAALPVLAPHYQHPLQRKLRWKRHLEAERSFAQFVQRLKAFEKATGKPLLLAYGGWGKSAGRPGQAVNKRSPPCMGVGLLRKLAVHFLVVVVPEPLTSKTCHLCGGDALRCEEVEQARRPARDARAAAALAKALAKTEDDEQRLKLQTRHDRVVAHRPHVRGVRCCTQCDVRLSRDRNGAANIGLNGKRLALGLGLFREPSPRQVQLQEASVATG